MTRPKELLMITVTRCSWAAGAVLIVASLSAPCDSPGVTVNPDRTTALLPRAELPGYDAGRLETRRPYERGKVPVVLIHGLWGSRLSSGRLLALGTQLCWRPSRFRQARGKLLASNEPDTFTSGFRREFPTSVGELVPGQPLLMALCDLAIDPSVRSHSIIADVRDRPGPGSTDGVVPYSSSHLESTDSELLIHGHHSCIDKLAAIREARRILREHAGIDPSCRTDQENHRGFESHPELKLRIPRKRGLQKTHEEEGTTMSSPNYFDRLVMCVQRVARHSYYPGIEQAIDQCLDEIDELTHLGLITAEQRGVLRSLVLSVNLTSSNNAASAA
jgi:hypothetical protein